MNISIVILTHNEAENIQLCLSALDWCDDVWVIDSGSTDGTVELAERAGARAAHQPWLGFAGQRNFAIDTFELKHPWLLHLDADELVTPELAKELEEIANAPAGPQQPTAYELPFRIFFMRRWLRHGGTYPGCQVRFGLRQALRFTQVGHGQREDIKFGHVGRTRNSLLHFNFSKGIRPWLDKHLVYARGEALASIETKTALPASTGLPLQTRLRRGLKAYVGVSLMRPMIRFLYTYFLRLGVFDGTAGFHYSILMSYYDYMTYLFRMELVYGKDTFQLPDHLEDQIGLRSP